MTSPLSLADMSENRRRELFQILTDKTKPDAYQECLVSVSDCEGSEVVRGHLIPNAWLRVIAEDSHVMAFVKTPFHRFRGEEGEIVQVTRRGINQTLTGMFSCKKHEQIFYPVDQRDLDITNTTNLNLLLYRGIIAQMWTQRLAARAWNDFSKEVPIADMDRLVADMHRRNSLGLFYYKAQVENCLFPEKCKTCNYGSKRCVKIVHKTRKLSGDPVLAVAEFPQGSRAIDIANCGITIFPTSGGHTVIEHCFTEEEGIWGKGNPLWPNLQSKSGKALEEAVSMRVLDYCENIAMNPTHWDKFGKKRQDAIRARATETMPTPFNSPERMQQQATWPLRAPLSDYAPNRRLLNLFQDKRY